MRLGAMKEEGYRNVGKVPRNYYEQDRLPPRRCPAPKIRHYMLRWSKSWLPTQSTRARPQTKRPHHFLVTGPGAFARGGFPQVSFAGFQSGTDGSGQSRTPVTVPRTGTTASNLFVRAQIETGSEKSSVVPSAYATLNRTGNGIEVRRRREMRARRCPCELCIVTLSIPISRTSLV